jgi:hypothetical protein
MSLLLSCAHLAWLQCQIFTSENLTQKFPLSEPCSHALLTEKFHCTLCRNLLAQNRETIETNFLFSQFSIQLWNHIHSISKQMYDRKQNIHENIKNIHRETTPARKLNHRFSSINSNLYMGFYIQFLCLISLLNAFHILQWYNEGCLYPFSLSNSKTI